MTDPVVKKSKRKYIAIVILVVVAAMAYIAFTWQKGSTSKVSYKEIKSERGNLRILIQATGIVQPENRVEIKPPVAGRVEQVLVNEGDVVRKGQILAWMSSTERAALLDAASARGKKEYQRWQELYRPTPVMAPIDGTIIRRAVESGQTFANTDALLIMSDRLTVKAQVDETDIARIVLKQKAEFVLDAYPNEKLLGHVEQIAHESKVVNNVTTYIVDILPDSPPEHIRSGMTANVNFIAADRENAILVPSESIKTREGKTYVLIPKGKGQEERMVKTGLSDGKRMEILEGLQENDSLLLPEFQLGNKTELTNPFSPNRRPRNR